MGFVPPLGVMAPRSWRQGSGRKIYPITVPTANTFCDHRPEHARGLGQGSGRASGQHRCRAPGFEGGDALSANLAAVSLRRSSVVSLVSRRTCLFKLLLSLTTRVRSSSVQCVRRSRTWPRSSADLVPLGQDLVVGCLERVLGVQRTFPGCLQCVVLVLSPRFGDLEVSPSLRLFSPISRVGIGVVGREVGGSEGGVPDPLAVVLRSPQVQCQSVSPRPRPASAFVRRAVRRSSALARVCAASRAGRLRDDELVAAFAVQIPGTGFRGRTR